MSFVAQPHVETERSVDAVRDVVDNVAGSAELEGVTIPEAHRRLAASFLAGEIDADEYRSRARSLTLADLGLDG
jgi:hypothetical protein